MRRGLLNFELVEERSAARLTGEFGLMVGGLSAAGRTFLWESNPTTPARCLCYLVFKIALGMVLKGMWVVKVK